MHLLTALTLIAQATDSTSVIRVNQVGYLPDAPKIAVLCALVPNGPTVAYRVEDGAGRVVVRAKQAVDAGAFGPCVTTYRLDFTSLRVPGRYVIVAGDVRSPVIRVAANAYAGGADTLLHYMRQQRSGWNPFFRDSVHRRDGNVVDDSGRATGFVPVSGGWADAADYLQYVATSATATYHLLAAYRDHPRAFADAFDARGLPGPNGTPDVLDEARHGLDWLLRMYPGGDTIYNQLGDDRDHTYLDLPTTDSSDYGWGKGRERAVYPCTGRPQGIFQYKNRSTGLASTAGKFAAAFALAARTYSTRDRVLAATFRQRAERAYALGARAPGVCQTAPGRSPYFYEEENWSDDMELAAAELHALTADMRYLHQARRYANLEPVTPWMGADTAKHYEWYPWQNAGHFVLSRSGDRVARDSAIAFYRRGIERVVQRARSNGFGVGIPFIWCSNDLMTSFATQALLYRQMTGDARFRAYEQAAIDWLFGANPWGTSMVIGYPNGGTVPRDPHSVVSMQFGPGSQLGGLVDGPVYRSIFQNLRGVALRNADEYAPFNTGFIVYHDDLGDYSTNEPIMDGTANLAYLLSALGEPVRPRRR
jgi:hypothetical protein